MRKDMAKVIVERGRVGGGGDRKGRAKKPEDLPKKQGMKKAHKDRKSLNETLNPLKRFLQSSVGRPWNKVYSEICENLKITSTVQEHVRGHLKDFVEVHAKVDGHKVMSQRSFYSGRYYELRDGGLYVDPITGILRKYKRRKTDEKRKPTDPMIYDFNQYLYEDGGKLLLHEGVLYKMWKDKAGEWAIFHKANAAHARIDALTLTGRTWYGNGQMSSAERFWRKWEKRIRAEKHEYWMALRSIFWDEYIKRDHAEEVARQKKENDAKIALAQEKEQRIAEKAALRAEKRKQRELAKNSAFSPKVNSKDVFVKAYPKG